MESPKLRIDTHLLRTLLERLSRHAFESFVTQGCSTSHSAYKEIPEAGEGVYYQPLIDSYGDSLHSVFVLQHFPIGMDVNPDYIDLDRDPRIAAKLAKIREIYEHAIGAWGMVSEATVEDQKLQSIAFLTNLSRIPREHYESVVIPQYYALISRMGLKIPTLFVGSYDSFLDLDADGTIEKFQSFLQCHSDGLAIELSPNNVSIREFATEEPFGALPKKRSQPLEPVYVDAAYSTKSVLLEFESLILSEPSERAIEEFLRANYREVFGTKYDRIETQLWLKFAELDITDKNRRLDVFMRNCVSGDWELHEIKKIVRLTGTARDIPVLSREITTAIGQLRNYSRVLSQDSVKRTLASKGVEYYEPTLHLVAGRSPQIPHAHWRWLVSQYKDIQFKTYDELLAEARMRLDDRLRALGPHREPLNSD